MGKKILSLIAMSASIYAVAQTKDSSKVQSLDEVIITANKIEQKQSSTGKVISVIGKDVLEKSTGKSVAQVLNEQVGITIAGAYNNLGTPQSVFMRGASNGRTLILMDGVPMNDPSQINGEFDLNLFNINDVERIEVCRGAESTLYGSDAVAGVINIITIKKDVKTPINAKFTTSLGNLNTFKNNVQLYGKLNKFTYQARVANLSSKGFSSAYDSAGNKNFDADGFNGTSANTSLQYQLSKTISLKGFVQYNKYKTDVDENAFLDDRDFTINNNTLNSGVGFNLKNDVVSLTANYQFTQNDRLFVNDSGHISGFSKFVESKFFSKAQFVELFASVKLGSGFTLLQGADYRLGNMNSRYLSISSFGPFNSTFKDTSMSQGSMYASLLYNNKNFNMEIGGRLNVHSRFGSNYTYTINPSYKINENLRAFASVSSGFKAPTLYQLFDGFSGNANLKAEKSVNYEGGLHYQTKQFNTRIVYFDRLINDGIDYNNVVGKYFNFLSQTVKGFELEATYKPSEKWNITANYTYLKPTENTQSRVNFKDTSYSILLRRPNHNLNVNIGYQLTEKLFVSVATKLVGERFDVGGYKKADVLLDSYFLVNAYAEYKFNAKVKCFFDAQNITNKQFFDIRGYNAIPTLLSVGATVVL